MFFERFRDGTSVACRVVQAPDSNEGEGLIVCILVLTDRPQKDERLVLRTIELAHRLDAQSVSVLVARSRDAFLATGCSFGVPDAGWVSPDMLSGWALSLSHSDVAIDNLLLARYRLDAAFYGLACKTVQSDASLRRTVATLANVVGVMAVCRETLRDEEGRLALLRGMWSESKRSWLICPENAESWKRIVVASRDDLQRSELIAWGHHWSERFDLPLAMIELSSPPPRSVWSAALQWSYARQHRELVRKSLLACGLGPGDLVLVNREPSIWPWMANSSAASLDDLIDVAPCSVGVIPKTSTVATRKLLFPHGLAHMDERFLGILTA